MDNDTELREIMQSIAEKSLYLIANFKQQPTQLAAVIEKYIELTSDFKHSL